MFPSHEHLLDSERSPVSGRPLLDELRSRGMLYDLTEGAEEALAAGPQIGYAGFDPTADSLHVGHLVPIMGLVHLQRAGHTPIALVGGGTALIGDPTGKSEERSLLERDEVVANAEAIRGQLEAFLDFEDRPNRARMVNNLDWLEKTDVLSFLRDVGKHFPVNVMLGKETIRRRLDDETAGISFTEFSYLLLQSYDFYRLFSDHGCRFQHGGSDQWGNITGGIELIRRAAGERAYGFVLPLLTNAAGTKFGKTEAGAVWLDPARTSPFRFYQYWLNTDDADVLGHLRYFTLMEGDEIDALGEALEERPHERAAQRTLAEDVTRRVHGDDGLLRAEQASVVLFGGAVDGLSSDEIEEIFADVPSSSIALESLQGEGLDIVSFATEVAFASSRGEARRGIEQGGVYLNGRRVEGVDARVGSDDALHGEFFVLRRGKKHHHLVRVAG